MHSMKLQASVNKKFQILDSLTSISFDYEPTFFNRTNFLDEFLFLYFWYQMVSLMHLGEGILRVLFPW